MNYSPYYIINLQVWEGNACKSLYIGGPCSSDENCDHHSKCSENKSCQCEKSYLSFAGETKCERLKTFGEACTSSKECDHVVPLVCSDFQCQCEDPLLVYEPLYRLCVAQLGQICKDKERQLSLHCVQGAICVQRNLNVPAKCACDGAHRISGDNKSCVPNVRH